MYKTKIRLVFLIIFAVLTILLLLFGALLYVSSTTTNNIFNIAIADKDVGKVWAIIMFAVAGACAVLTICFFIFYLLAVSHNKKTIEIIEKLKIKYAETKQVPVEKVEIALDELIEEIKECEKNGVEYVPPVAQPNQPNNVVQVNNYTTVTNAQQPMMVGPNQQYMMPQNNYYAAPNATRPMAPGAMPPPPGAPRPPMAPGAAPRPPMAPVNQPR